MGNSGWNRETILPYLRHVRIHQPAGESFDGVGNLAHQGEAVESNDGPIHTPWSDSNSSDTAWFASCKQIMSDLKYLGDQLVYSHCCNSSRLLILLQEPQLRCNWYYVAPSLRVIADANSEKVILQKRLEVVVSIVAFRSKSGEHFTVKATNEVILAAVTHKVTSAT